MSRHLVRLTGTDFSDEPFATHFSAEEWISPEFWLLFMK